MILIIDNLDAETVYALFLGILGYKIHFDSNGDAEFNLTLLDMQAMRKLNHFCCCVLSDWVPNEKFKYENYHAKTDKQMVIEIS